MSFKASRGPVTGTNNFDDPLFDGRPSLDDAPELDKPGSSGPAPKGVPWKKQGDSIFFPAQDIDYKRQFGLYPYRFLVWDISKGCVHGGGSSAFKLTEDDTQEKGLRYLSYARNYTNPNAWECILPITPQQLQIQDQFAIQTSALVRGIAEEHGGLRFKMISASGTTGIWPRKPVRGGTIARKGKTSGWLGHASSVFGGTLQAGLGLQEAIGSAVKVTSGGHPASTSDADLPGEYNEANGALDPGGDEFSSGYFMAHFMAQFLERYVEMKRNPKNKHLRLVLDMPKQNQSFVVSPVSFNLSQSAQKPNEIMFNFQLKAWMRIDLSLPKWKQETELIKLDVNQYQNIGRMIQSARKVVSASDNVLKAVRSDWLNALDKIRQVSLLVKDLGGLVYSAIDLPGKLIEDLESTIKDATDNIKDAFDRPVSSQKGGGGGSSSVAAGSPGSVVQAIEEGQARNEYIPDSYVNQGALGGTSVENNQVDPVNNVFKEPEKHFEFFDEMSLDQLNINAAQQEIIDDEIELASLLTVDDIREVKVLLQGVARDVAAFYGADSDIVNTVYNLGNTDNFRKQELTVEENELLLALYDIIQSFDMLTATKKLDDRQIESPMQYVGRLATNANIPFDQSSSKILAPVPFGLTIEEIAARYLGDANKWIEIATLNNLLSPYIDEEGYFMPLLSNADGRQFTVDNSADILWLGQTIMLSSDTVGAISRQIIDIEEVNETTHLITVDGEADLDNLSTVDDARLQGYLPHTVNSQNRIYIPSALESEPDDRIREIPNLEDANMTQIAKIDWLLDDNGDIAINKLGDLRVSNGLTNLIQALKLKIMTERGSLLRHPEYGVNLSLGGSVADVTGPKLVESLNATISQDPRFEGIDQLDVIVAAPFVKIDLSVRLHNSTGVLPISFKIKL